MDSTLAAKWLADAPLVPIWTIAMGVIVLKQSINQKAQRVLYIFILCTNLHRFFDVEAAKNAMLS
jgi:hypothetical protein